MNYIPAAVGILKERQYYSGKAFNFNSSILLMAAAKFVTDCDPGAAIRIKTPQRLAVAVVQCHLKDRGINPGKIDGYDGPMTQYAVSLWKETVDYFRDKEPPKPIWPYQSDVPAFYGDRGEHQVKVTSPYMMFLAWNNDQELNSFLCHEKVADSLSQALEEILREYGEVRIRNFGLDQFGGCLNVRLMRGSKHQWSMHSWGIAVDWYPQKNQLRWGRDRAMFAQPEYNAFWEIWESLGWVSLGRERNYDWMHVQAARLNS